MNAENIEMQREASPMRFGDIVFNPLTLRRVNAAGAMRCSVFNLDEAQRAELSSMKTYRGIIRDIIIVLYLCAHDEMTADAAMWNPVGAVSEANAWAAEHQIHEASENFADYQMAMWSLVNPIFTNDTNPEAPITSTELGRPTKKKPGST